MRSFTGSLHAQLAAVCATSLAIAVEDKADSQLPELLTTSRALGGYGADAYEAEGNIFSPNALTACPWTAYERVLQLSNGDAFVWFIDFAAVVELLVVSMRNIRKT